MFFCNGSTSACDQKKNHGNAFTVDPAKDPEISFAGSMMLQNLSAIRRSSLRFISENA